MDPNGRDVTPDLDRLESMEEATLVRTNYVLQLI